MAEEGAQDVPKLQPRAGDDETRRLGLEAWEERAAVAEPELGQRMRELVQGNRRPVLEAIFGCSPYLTRLALGNPVELVDTLAVGADATFDQLERQLENELTPNVARSGDALAGVLRRHKRRASLVVAAADLAQLWTLEQVTRALTRLADRTLDVAVRHLIRRGIEQRQIEPVDDGREPEQCGLIVLGMGKLGAGELNYSSDVDLILLYDEERVRVVGREEASVFYARLARQLVRLMSDQTRDGYVFRIDLRLRPDPYSTPPALSRAAAETYYESMGQNWERAAMIKARPVAGDIDAGHDFLDRIQPFIWRRHLDYAALRDIQSIKRQIDAKQAGRSVAAPGEVEDRHVRDLLGWNVKLGRGGIREIEFFVQTQQLIWGGRRPQLRAPGTCEMLERLAESGLITPQTAAELTNAYALLRLVEHRLQMVDDRQTHTLPEQMAGLERAARFIGVADADALGALLGPVRETVEQHWQSLFPDAPALGGSGSLVFTGQESDPDTLATLSRLGFGDCESIARTVRAWHHGGTRATRSTRARELLTELTPQLLDALGQTIDPDAAFTHFAEFVRNLPAGIQLFSLFAAQPALLALVAAIVGDAPRLARQLAREPILIDAITAPGFLDPPPGGAAQRYALQEAIADPGQLQLALERLSRAVRDARFRIGVQMLHRDLPPEDAGRALADLAGAAIHALLPHVWDDFARLHGRIGGAQLVVVALGKLGSREMTVTSDLDLICIYDGAADGISDGAKPLPLTTYMARLCQRLITALTAPGAEGNLYDVDMRLRPSGNAGPIASSLEAFRRYHAEQAWTWERMALTRARIVAGSVDLAGRVGRSIREILGRASDPDRLLCDVADMRQRIRAARPARSAWDIRDRQGGLIDLEFIAQYLSLRHGLARPAGPLPALFARLSRGGILPGSRAEALGDAARFWQRVQGLLRLTLGETPPASPPLGVLALVRRATGVTDGAAAMLPVDADALQRDMEQHADRVAACFAQLIEEPAREARGRLDRHPQSEG